MRPEGNGVLHPDPSNDGTQGRRRLVQLAIDNAEETDALMDMLLAKRRAGDRRSWLERKGNLAILP